MGWSYRSRRSRRETRRLSGSESENERESESKRPRETG